MTGRGQSPLISSRRARCKRRLKSVARGGLGVPAEKRGALEITRAKGEQDLWRYGRYKSYPAASLGSRQLISAQFEP